MEIFQRCVKFDKSCKTKEFHHPPQLTSETHHLKDPHILFFVDSKITIVGLDRLDRS